MSAAACGCVSLRSSSKTERQKILSSKTLRERGVAKRESYLTTPDQSGVLAGPSETSFCLGSILDVVFEFHRLAPRDGLFLGREVATLLLFVDVDGSAPRLTPFLIGA